jgi:hypothetical protein
MHVQEPLDIDDNSIRCIGFQSMELRRDGTYQPVTVQSYHRHRATLYRIAAPVVRDMYSRGSRSTKEVAKKIREVHQRLQDWQSNLPPELKLRSFVQQRQQQSDLYRDPAVQVFRLQALALQVTYDNVMILLHRPLLQYELSQHSPSHTSTKNPDNGSNSATTTDPERTAKASRQHCWAAALRTSFMIESVPDLLNAARPTPFGAYIGMIAFTSGVMLGIFALSNPLSVEATEAKRGIGRIISMPSTPGYKAALWAQSSRVLEGLLRLILEEEVKALTSGNSRNKTGQPFLGNDASDVRPHWPNDASVQTGYSGHEAMSIRPANSTSDSAHLAQNYENVFDVPDAAISEGLARPFTFMDPEGNFDDAIQSLQRGKLLPPNSYPSASRNLVQTDHQHRIHKHIFRRQIRLRRHELLIDSSSKQQHDVERLQPPKQFPTLRFLLLK